jgi:hypothetical protein
VTTRRATFLDVAHQAALERDGYVHLPFLDPDEVERLRDVYAELGPAPDDARTSCISSFHTADRDYQAAVHDRISAVLAPRLAATFDRQSTLLAQFLIKWPGDGGEIPLHQDTSLVDEAAHRSCEVWIALEDTDDDNGQLWMVPGSHGWLPTIRGIQSWFHPPFDEVETRIRERHAVSVPMAAGDAVVFDHAVLHFSLPNTTTNERLAVITDLVPDDAPLVHYFGHPDGTVEVYEVPATFWFDSDIESFGRPPAQARRHAVVDASCQPLTDEGLDRLVASGAAVDRLADRPSA